MIIWSDILSGLSLSVCFSFCNIHCQAQLSWSMSHQLGLVLLLVSAIRSHFLYFIAPHLSCSVWSGPNSVLNVNVCQGSNSVTMHYPCLEGSILFNGVSFCCVCRKVLIPVILLYLCLPKLVPLFVSVCLRFQFSVSVQTEPNCFLSARVCLRGPICVCLNWYHFFVSVCLRFQLSVSV